MVKTAQDLELLTKRETMDHMQLLLRPLSDEEVRRGFDALDKLKSLGERIALRRGGQRLSDSVELIRRERQKRSKRLIGGPREMDLL